MNILFTSSTDDLRTKANDHKMDEHIIAKITITAIATDPSE